MNETGWKDPAGSFIGTACKAAFKNTLKIIVAQISNGNKLTSGIALKRKCLTVCTGFSGGWHDSIDGLFKLL